MTDKACFDLPMKIFALAATALLLISCKSRDEASQSTEESPPAPQIPSGVELSALLNQKRDLQKQLDQLVAAGQLDPTGEIQTIIQEELQASDDLRTILDTHPTLQKLNKDLSYWRTMERSARTSKRDFEIEQAAKQILEITTKRHNLTRELPAIREAEDRIARSKKQMEELRRSLAEKSPEGKKLVEQIKSIEDQVNSAQ